MTICEIANLAKSYPQDAAMGIILRAAGSTAGWTTGSGLEGPAYSMKMAGSEMPALYSASRLGVVCVWHSHVTSAAIVLFGPLILTLTPMALYLYR